MINYRFGLWLVVFTFGLTVVGVMIFPSASAADSSISYIHQGQKIYVNDTVDISGTVVPYPQLAYWDGFNMYNSAPAYIITLPNNQKGWYKFYVDPAIFATRLGSWYKYDEKIGYESHGNNLAFVVAKENVSQVTPNPTTNDISKTFTPLPTSSKSTPTQMPVPILTPTPPQWNFEKSDYALWISILIVVLCFVFFELYRFRS